jgi:hypothetical protein
MKGYGFLDADGKMQYRTQEYIEQDNPFFWQQNTHDIIRTWKFDTDDLDSMYNMFRQVRDIFRTYKYGQQTVVDFCSMIGFDIKLLKDANKIQSE